MLSILFSLSVLTTEFSMRPTSRTPAQEELAFAQAFSKFGEYYRLLFSESLPDNAQFELRTNRLTARGEYDFVSEGCMLSISSNTGSLRSFSNLNLGGFSRPFMPRAGAIITESAEGRRAIDVVCLRLGLPAGATLKSFEFTSDSASGPGTVSTYYQMKHRERRLVGISLSVDLESHSGRPMSIMRKFDYNIQTQEPTLLPAEAEANAQLIHESKRPNPAQRQQRTRTELCYVCPNGKLGGPLPTFTSGKPNYRIAYMVQYGNGAYSIWIDAITGTCLGGTLN